MSEYVTLEEAAKARGESPDTIAWLMTTKDCKIYLRFDESQESSIAISTYEGLPNHHSLYVIERGCYPLAAGEHHSCALLDNASVKCWGYNNKGQLGINSSAHMGDGSGEMGDNLPVVDL